MQTPSSQRGRILELDGLRGGAVIAVVLGHYLAEVPSGFSLFGFGWLGVDIFFALSGFLIAGILLDNRHASNYFSTFYIRRSCRIFPIYYLFIPALVLLIQSMRADGCSWLDAPLPLVAYLTYTQNLFVSWMNYDGGLALLPTWTLAVEEQFYMILPILVFVVPRRRLLPVCLLLILVSPVVRTALLCSVGASHFRHLSVNVCLPCRWDTLFWGVIAAIVWRDERLKEIVTRRGGAVLKVALLVAIWSVPACMFAEKVWQLPFRTSLGLTVVGLGTASYVLLVVTGQLHGRVLRWAPLRFFGSISYGLYLVHQPMLVFLHGLILDARPDIGSLPQLLVTVLAAALSVAVAWLSWTYVESRIVRFGHRFHYDSDRSPLEGIRSIMPASHDAREFGTS